MCLHGSSPEGESSIFIFFLFALTKAPKPKVRVAEAGAVPCRGGREGRGH